MKKLKSITRKVFEVSEGKRFFFSIIHFYTWIVNSTTWGIIAEPLFKGNLEYFVGRPLSLVIVIGGLALFFYCVLKELEFHEGTRPKSFLVNLCLGYGLIIFIIPCILMFVIFIDLLLC